MKPYLLVIQLSLLRACLAAKKCYYPDGSEAKEDGPCDPDAEQSACCALGVLAFACLSNGLCVSPAGRLARGSCTDQEWKSGACAKYCTHRPDKGWDLVSCSNVTSQANSYCCDAMANCCDQGIGRFEAGVLPIFTWATYDKAMSTYAVQTPLGQQMSPTSTPTTASTDADPATKDPASQTSEMSNSSVTPMGTIAGSGTSNTLPSATGGDGTSAQGQSGTPDSAASTSTSTSGLSVGAQAGIGAGAAAGAILVGAVAYLWWRLDRTQKMLASATAAWGEMGPQQTYPETTTSMPPSYYAAAPVQKYELGPTERYELQGQDFRSAELPATSPVSGGGGRPGMYPATPGGAI